MNNIIRVFIVDDHVVVRSGIRLLLEAENDIDVVGEASDGVEALEILDENQPDVVLMDITMPLSDGIETTKKIKQQWPGVQVLILTMHRSEEYFFESVKAGASGYILKASDSSDLVNAVRIVSRGEIFLNPAMAQKLVKDYLHLLEHESDPQFDLSARELEIFHFLVKGFSNKEIAEELVISPSTVYTHKANLMRKLGINNRRELIQFASDHGLLQNI